MADFTDRIKLVFEAVTSDATKGIGSVKGATDEAQSGFAKLKGVAGDAIGAIATSPAAIAAAGVAIGKVAFDLASSFGEAALSAQDFATASGLAVQDASRWQEVAGDLGVSTDTLEGAVNKLNIAGSKGVLTQLGIGGADTNEQLLNAFQHLNGIDDAQQRASEGAKIFGKSWAQLAPLIDESASLRDNLAAVSDQKVIDEGEVEKAKHFRDAIDTLSDKFEDLKLAVGGELIEPLADLADTLGNVEHAVESVTDVIPGMDGGLLSIATGPLRNVADGFNTLTDSSSSLTDRARGLGQAVTGAIPGPLGSWAGGLFDVSDASDDAAEATQRSADAAKIAAQAAQDAADANAEQEASLLKLTNATLAQFNSNLALADAGDRTTDAFKKYQTSADAAEQSSWGNAEANDAARQSMNDAEQAALAQAAAAAKLATDQATARGETLGAAEAATIQANELRTLAGTLAPGNPLRQHLLDYADQIEAIPKTAETTITANTKTAAQQVQELTDSIFRIAGQIFSFTFKANNTPSSAAATAAPGSTALTAPATASAGVRSLSAAPVLASAAPTALAAPTAGTVVNVNVSVAPFTQPAEVGRAIADYLDAFYRRSGTRARAVA